MLRRSFVFLYFAALICSVRMHAEEKVKVFHNDGTRNHFLNLLQYLVKLNEERINEIKKMNKAQDRGSVREVLRTSGGLSHANGANKNRKLLILLISNNQSDSTKGRVSHVHSFDSRDIEGLNTDTRKTLHRYRKLAPNVNHYEIKQLHDTENRHSNYAPKGLPETYHYPASEQKVENNNYKIRKPDSEKSISQPETDQLSGLGKKNTHSRKKRKGKKKLTTVTSTDEIKHHKPRRIHKNIEPIELETDVDKEYSSLEQNNKMFFQDIKLHEYHKQEDRPQSKLRIGRDLDKRKEHKHKDSLTLFKKDKSKDTASPVTESDLSKEFLFLRHIHNHPEQKEYLKSIIDTSEELSSDQKVPDRIEILKEFAMSDIDMNVNLDKFIREQVSPEPRQERSTAGVRVDEGIKVKKVPLPIFAANSKNRSMLNENGRYGKRGDLWNKQTVLPKLDKVKARRKHAETGQPVFRAQAEVLGSKKKVDALRKGSAGKSWHSCLDKKSEKICRRACNNAYKNVCERLKCTSGSKKDLKRECRRSCRKAFRGSRSSSEESLSTDSSAPSCGKESCCK